jgi:TRAP-type transport system small permease protein
MTARKVRCQVASEVGAWHLRAVRPGRREDWVMGRLLDLYCSFLKLVIALCLAVMVVLVFGNVFLRYGFNSGITVSEELSRWLLVWLTFLGAIVALRQHAHLGVDSFVNLLPAFGKKICFVISYATMVYCDWLLLVGSWQQTLLGWGDRAPATNLSYALFYGVGVVFGISAGVILIYDLLRVLTGQASEAELVAVKENEEQA